MATPDRIPTPVAQAALDLEIALAWADTTARALYEATGDESFHDTKNPPGWVMLFRNEIDRIQAAADPLLTILARESRNA